MVRFKRWVCEPRRSRYANGRRALVLHDIETGEVIAKATVNLPEETLKEEELFIKDYGENAGVLEALLEASVISKPLEWIRTGHVEVARCVLLPSALWKRAGESLRKHT